MLYSFLFAFFAECRQSFISPSHASSPPPPPLAIKFIHKLLLLNIPNVIYNPISNILNAPFSIQPQSTYVNFRLSSPQVQYLNEHLKEFSSTPLSLTPIRLSKWDIFPSYYLSVNIYNCTSPLFVNGNRPVARCEINTYIKTATGELGTVILDYSSNGISIDPVNVFQSPRPTLFQRTNVGGVSCFSKTDVVGFEFQYIPSLKSSSPFRISHSLISYTDSIYYKNTIYDKLFYDSTLVEPVMEKINDPLVKFQYRDLSFSTHHSAFYFKNKIDFVCCLWKNI
jgi:hypothetical protein